MRFAVIDLGTNSVRFDVYDLKQNQQIKRLHREKVMVRLGQGVFLDGKLDRNAIRRTTLAFLRFRQIAQDLQVRRYIAFGTSALREASDSQRFIEFLQKKTGIQIRIISGTEEARLIAQGVITNENIPSEKYAILDIGGGSTEIIICEGSKILSAESFPLGTARLQQVYLKKSPPREASLLRLRKHIQNSLNKSQTRPQTHKISLLIGSSGTVRALHNLIGKRSSLRKKASKKLLSKKLSKRNSLAETFSPSKLSGLIIGMSQMNTTQLLGIPRMEADRVDMILAGAVLLEEIVHALGVHIIRPTQFSLRDGILDKQIKFIKKKSQSSRGMKIDDVISLAQRFGLERPRALRIQKMSETIFDELKHLHKLSPCWRDYLVTAALLRKSGESISPVQAHQHSYYIVKHAQLSGLSKQETEFIALMCLYHSQKKIDLEQIDFKKSFFDKRRQVFFFKLLAILRIVDAMDADPKSKVIIHKVAVVQKSVKIIYASSPRTDFETFRVAQQKPLFESVYRKSVILESVEPRD